MNNQQKHNKFSPHTRILAVERVEIQRWSVAASAKAIGASRSILYRWIRRYRTAGPDALLERSSRPHNMPGLLPEGLVESIHKLRSAGRSLSQIAAMLQLVRSTVHRWLRRLGLNRLPRPVREAVQRYEASAPGELLHIDIKKLRGFDYAGRKFIDDRGRRQRGALRQYLHVCIDSHSRYAFAMILPRENGEACIHFLHSAIAHFAELGITVQRFLTDNASAYRGIAMAKEVRQLGIRHSFTRIRRPQTNGKAERFIRSAMTEWGYLRYECSTERDAALPAWLNHYNHSRSHSSIGYRPPVSRICAQRAET